MIRYLRLFVYFLRFSFSRAMEFRVDFFFRVVMDIFFYAVNILFFKVIFLHTSVLGGWTENQMLVFIAGFLLIDAMSMTLFSNNLWVLSMSINRGDLDYHLVRPVSSLFFCSLRDFAANSFLNLVIAVGIFAWALVRYEGPVTVAGTTLFILLLCNGTYLRYCVRMLTIIPAFWLHTSGGLEYVFFHMARFVERPDRIFTGVTRVILTTVLPFSLMVSFPARLFIEGFNVGLFLGILVVTAAFTAVMLVSWKAGLRAYTSASS